MFAWTAAIATALAAVALGTGLVQSRRRVRKQARELEARQAEVARLTAASHARSRFLAMMSHEIRTPLTGIVGFAEALTDDTLSPAGRRAVDSIRSASSSLQALLGDILDFSRIDAGALPMQPVPTDLGALLHEVRDEFAPQARQRGLAFGLSIADGARRWAIADRLRLRQIVVNLVANAIRYTESGFVRISAAPSPSDPDSIVIRVTDTGLGIAPEDCRRIFDAFAQAADPSAVHSGGGVGLGLAIADGLVRAMGGSLSLDSTLGQGSTFTVVLPLPACAAMLSAPVPGSQRAAAAAAARILLVDDVEMNRELFAAMLKRAGHEVVTAEDGEAALRCLERSSFDLAFIDIQMPFMTGIELTRRIRSAEDPAVANLPIVALSAAAYGEDRTRAEEAGMNDYVTKPATREDIAAAVARVRAGTTDAGTAPAPDEPAGILDTETFEQQRATFGDDRILRFLAMLAEELGRRRTGLDDAAQRDDRGEISQHVHAVASSAGNLGFRQLMDLARALERAAAKMSADELAAALDTLRRSMDETNAVIAALIGEIDTSRTDRRATG